MLLLVVGTPIAVVVGTYPIPPASVRRSSCGTSSGASANCAGVLPVNCPGTQWLARRPGQQSATGSALSFSFTGLVIASTLYSMPFVVQPLHSTFESVGKIPLETAWSLRASRLDAFLTVASPLALRGYITAMVLGFAHTLGEFGVVLMVGGSIPGKTKVISIDIYDHVEVLEYTEAHILSGGLLIFSFCVLLIVYTINRRLPIHLT